MQSFLKLVVKNSDPVVKNSDPVQPSVSSPSSNSDLNVPNSQVTENVIPGSPSEIDEDNTPLAELSRQIQEEKEENMPLAELAKQLKNQKELNPPPQAQKRTRSDSDSGDETLGRKFSKEVYEKRTREDSSSDEDGPPDKIPCVDLPDLPTDTEWSDIEVVNVNPVVNTNQKDAKVKLLEIMLSAHKEMFLSL